MAPPRRNLPGNADATLNNIAAAIQAQAAATNQILQHLQKLIIMLRLGKMKETEMETELEMIIDGLNLWERDLRLLWVHMTQ